MFFYIIFLFFGFFVFIDLDDYSKFFAKLVSLVLACLPFEFLGRHQVDCVRLLWHCSEYED